MQRTCLTAFAILVMGALTWSPLAKAWQQACTPRPEKAALVSRIGDAMAALDLYSVCDPPHLVVGGGRFLVSDLPITADRHARLSINRPDLGVWQGTVAIYVGSADMYRVNLDAEHPERYAVWGDSFVYGDPVLIARLRTAAL